MTPERIAELERLCEAATPGPWYPDEQLRVFVGTPNGRRDENGSYSAVAFCEIDDDYNDADLKSEYGNQEFIAAARTALPEALAELKRLATCEHPKIINIEYMTYWCEVCGAIGSVTTNDWQRPTGVAT